MQQVRASICHPTGLPVFFIFVPDRDRELGAKKLRLWLFPFRGKKRDKKKIKEYNAKKIKEAEQTQREIAQLKKSHKNVERVVADLKEKHYNEINVMELDHLVEPKDADNVVEETFAEE